MLLFCIPVSSDSVTHALFVSSEARLHFSYYKPILTELSSSSDSTWETLVPSASPIQYQISQFRLSFMDAIYPVFLNENHKCSSIYTNLTVT